MHNLNDCFAVCEEGKLSLGNTFLKKTIDGSFSISTEVCDLGGLSEPFLQITAAEGGRVREFRVWGDLAAYEELEHSDEEPLMTLSGQHWVLRAVKLHTLTDNIDTLVTQVEVNLFARNIPPQMGNIFLLENPADGNAIVIIAKATDFYIPTLQIKGGSVILKTGGCGYVVGYCNVGEGEAFCRSYYRHICRPSRLYTMSNTWGDCNAWTRVNHEFIRKEIDAAAELGVDIVQIDDGWQVGSTADLSLRDEQGRRFFPDFFWQLSEERFPDGILPLSRYAAERGIKMGLWFAPDSHGDFALLERDLSVLKYAYDNWDIRFFKLDMIHIETDRARERMLELLSGIYAFGNDVSVELDVTNGKRLGYLCGAEYGSIFEENRYTKWGNSFPHRVLRNIWTLSHFIPPYKIQYELVNPDLNTEKYAADDPFAPRLYDMDYLFAITMFSNPLFWFEMQYLSAERREELARVKPAWQEHVERLAQADVTPIGQKPSGRAFSGFCADLCDGGYAVLFRESTEHDSYTFELPYAYAGAELLASNADVSLESKGKSISATFSKPRAYAFMKLNK